MNGNANANATLARPARALLALALFGACLGLTAVSRRQAQSLRSRWPAEADLMYLPSSTTLRWLTLGHTELGADLVAARANVYYGTQLGARAPLRWLHNYLHTAIDLDPQFHRVYLSGAAMVVYHGGAITPDNVIQANGILERGVKSFPDDWNLLFQLGFNKFYELPSAAAPDDPRIPGWRQEGLEALRQATLFEGVPAWLPNLVARLLTQQGADELAIRHLEQAYAATSSEETRTQIRGKLETLQSRLQGRQLIDRMEEERQRFEADLAAAYPYAPEAFSVIAGPRLPRVTALP
jgi:hypothetical protein